MVYQKYREIKQWGKTNTRIFKRATLANNKIPMPKFDIPEAVKSINAVVYNPNDPSFFKRFENKMEDVEILHPAFREQSILDHPLYNPIPCRLFESLEPFSDGIDQVCDLIKAVKIEGLPSSVTDVQHSILRNTAEEDVRDCIMQGERYDPTLEKLEKRFDKILFWAQYPVLHGTPVLKRNNIILEALYRKVVLSAIKEGKLIDLRCDRDQYLSAFLNNAGFNERPLVIRGQPHLIVQTETPLQPWIENEGVQASKTEQVPNIAPISPFIDLSKSNLYNRTVISPRSMIPNLHLDTLFISRQQSQKYPWTTEQNTANALMLCFGAALAEATKGLSADQICLLSELKRPVLTKAIQLVDGKFDFVAIQLNTLDLNGKNGIKNFIWYEKAVPFYKPKPYWENMEKVEDLNLDAFNRFVTLLLKR